MVTLSSFSTKIFSRPINIVFDVSRKMFLHENKTEETFQLHKFPLSDEKIFRRWDNVFRKSCRKRLQRLGGTFWEKRKKFERFCTNFSSGFRAKIFIWILSQISVSVIVKNTIDVWWKNFWIKKPFFRNKLQFFPELERKILVGLSNQRSRFSGCLSLKNFLWKKSVVFRIFCEKFQPPYQDCIWCIWSDRLT